MRIYFRRKDIIRLNWNLQIDLTPTARFHRHAEITQTCQFYIFFDSWLLGLVVFEVVKTGGALEIAILRPMTASLLWKDKCQMMSLS
jgi:hypothetical protein